MPVYEFGCDKCGIIFEEMHPIDTMPEFARCPQCYSLCRKIISRTGKPVIKMAIHADSGLPQSWIDRAPKPELFELNKERRGGVIDPEDM
jgi:putative FmdB family regulatory protein